MCKISCEICIDLMPLVKDEVASDDSKQAVYEHMRSCENCRELYGEEVIFENSEKEILAKIKRNLTGICLVIIIMAILFGISLWDNELIFYNILIMPTIGGISYFSLKKKSIYVAVAVFGIVYLRWLYDNLGYLLSGEFLEAFIAPLWWSLIYLGLVVVGIIVAILLHYGFKKEEKNEKDI